MFERRSFLKSAGLIPAAAILPAAAATTTNLADVSKVRTRHIAKFDVLYKTPRGNPNGLALTRNPDEMWVINQAAGSHASLIKISDGSLIREFPTGTNASSGILVDDDNVMWVTSTYNRLIVAMSPEDGKVIGKYPAHGAGRIYEEAGDPPARGSNLAPAYPRPPRPERPAGQAALVMGATAGQLHHGDSKLPPGQVPLDMEEMPAGTGSHGIIGKGNLLYVVSPPSRTIFVVDKKSWVVQNRFPTPGNRPHGITWSDASRTKFWNADSNMNAFFLHDAETGWISEKIQLPDNSPVIHGAKLVGDAMYCCDDTGWIWRFKI